MLLFDVQSYQIKEVSELQEKATTSHSEVPIVAMRIQTINEVTQNRPCKTLPLSIEISYSTASSESPIGYPDRIRVNC